MTKFYKRVEAPSHNNQANRAFIESAGWRPRLTDEGVKPAKPWEEAPNAACVLSVLSLTLVQVGRTPAGPQSELSLLSHL